MDASDITGQIVAGAIAGDLAVSGIQYKDKLMLVLDLSGAGLNLASEFTVTADGNINNATGTSTAGHSVLVVWQKRYHTAHKFETGQRQGRSSF